MAQRIKVPSYTSSCCVLFCRSLKHQNFRIFKNLYHFVLLLNKKNVISFWFSSKLKMVNKHLVKGAPICRTTHENNPRRCAYLLYGPYIPQKPVFFILGCCNSTSYSNEPFLCTSKSYNHNIFFLFSITCIRDGWEIDIKDFFCQKKHRLK